MSFSDDQASPAAPFSGDETGQIFDAPDMVLQSPTTAERVVDTQSGFLVVVKAIEGRQSLSVKRRLGTPPSSSILLTPDESVKLSRILSGAAPLLDRRSRALSPEAEQWLATFENESDEAIDRAQNRSRSFLSGALRGILPATVISLLLFGALIGIGVQYAAQKVQTVLHKTAAAPAILPADPLEPAKVEEFARTFVTEMLDFNPKTYRISQIRAMAAMAPEVVDTYWSDTHFPLSPNQLKSLPQGTKIFISRTSPQRLDASTTNVDVYGELINGTRSATPLHLKLKLGLDENKHIRVLSQKDITGQ